MDAQAAYDALRDGDMLALLDALDADERDVIDVPESVTGQPPEENRAIFLLIGRARIMGIHSGTRGEVTIVFEDDEGTAREHYHELVQANRDRIDALVRGDTDAEYVRIQAENVGRALHEAVASLAARAARQEPSPDRAPTGDRRRDALAALAQRHGLPLPRVADDDDRGAPGMYL
jgi:hypothetical protein